MMGDILSLLGNAGWVHEGALARSAAPDKAHLPDLKVAGLVSLIDLRAEATLEKEGAAAGLRYLHLPTVDHAPVSEADLARFYAWIADPANLPALLFCHLGSGRTGYVAARVRLEKDKWRLHRVKREACRYRVPHLLCWVGLWLDPAQVIAVERFLKKKP